MLGRELYFPMKYITDSQPMNCGEGIIGYKIYSDGKLIGTKKGNKVFKFQMPMEATNHLEVKAGEYSDSAVIYKTDKARPEYKLKKGDSSNWM